MVKKKFLLNDDPKIIRKKSQIVLSEIRSIKYVSEDSQDPNI